MKKIDFSKINRAGAHSVAVVNALQQEYLVIGAIFALGPVAITYGLGLGVARLRRGLRDQDEREE